MKTYRALFVAAYYGLLRIRKVSKSLHSILARNTHIGINKDKIMFVLLTSKMHNKGDKPPIVKITRRKSAANVGHAKQESSRRSCSDTSAYCPFKIIKGYLEVRPPSKRDDEQFFVFRNGSPVLPANVRLVLVMAITAAKLNHSNYSFHCFRAGRSCDLLDLGLSVETIKKLGRWKSNAVFNYLRS